MSLKWSIKKQNKFSFAKYNRNIIKKATATAVLLSSLTISLVFATESHGEELIKTIYHVYAGEKYVGAVSDTAGVREIVKKKEQEASKEFQELTVNVGSSISIIPEQVFSQNTNDEATLEKLKEQINVKAVAFALQINNESVIYLKDLDAFEEAIRLLKLEYVSEEQLKELEENKYIQSELPKLKNGESRIIDIKLSETVLGVSTKTEPLNIITPEEAVEVLKTGSLVKETYKVQAGDVLGKIASKHGLTAKQLLELNPNLTLNSVLQIGQEINVTVEKPLVDVEIVFEKVNVEKIDYAKIVENDEEMYKGEKQVKQEGAYGKQEVSYLIKEVNGKRIEKEVTGTSILREPEDRIVVVGTKVIASRGTGSFAWPTSGGYISSNMGERWGAFHQGIDIARPSNYNIKAADNGVVTFTGWDGSYGNKIVINHNNGYETVYAHLSEIDVSVGQVVPQGYVIGIMGTTGNSTGIHLHFEVHENGTYINPLSVLN